MNIYTPTGYTHSGGFCLCTRHADYGKMVDENNESGFVQPIFLGDEWDCIPVCDVCWEEIDVQVLGREDDNEPLW